MQTSLNLRTVKLFDFQTFSWPVRIRVRANKPQAPRRSPILPASTFFRGRPEMVLRTLEHPSSRPNRRAPDGRLWHFGGVAIGCADKQRPSIRSY